jgi:hypothetical protein
MTTRAPSVALQTGPSSPPIVEQLQARKRLIETIRRHIQPIPEART